MNLKLVIASGISLFAASASFADSYDFQDFTNVVSTKSRAEVIAELDAARANGTAYQVLDTQYPGVAQKPAMQRSRQEVLAELERFRALNTNFNSDVNYPDVIQAAPPGRRLAGMEMPSSPR